MGSREFVAGKARWSVRLVVNAPDAALCKPGAKCGKVGVDIGYRRMSSGALRVAYVHGSDGAGRELRIPATVMTKVQSVWDMQSERALLCNDARKALAEWMADRDIPDWLREDAATIRLWKGMGRMRRLVRKWAHNRFPGDEEVFEVLRYWRSRETHLWQYSEHWRDQIYAWRKDTYRKWADELARRYHTAFVETVDLRELLETLRPPEERKVPDSVRRIANMACLSSLRDVLRNRMPQVFAIDPENTTKTCYSCKNVCKWDQRRELRHVCEHCGAEWDQDDNAARNLLAIGTEKLVKGELILDSEKPKKPSRSERFRAAREKKDLPPGGPAQS